MGKVVLTIEDDGEALNVKIDFDPPVDEFRNIDSLAQRWGVSLLGVLMEADERPAIEVIEKGRFRR